jgi:tetratricopeptide (TPR) repeat protein
MKTHTVTRILWITGFMIVIAGGMWRIATRVALANSVALLAADDAQQSLHILERLRNWGVDSSVIEFNTGVALLQLGRYEEAALSFHLVAKSDVTRERRGAALFGAGNAEAMSSRYNDAAGTYRDSLRMTPDDDDIRFNLAWVMARLNKSQDSPTPIPDPEINKLDRLTAPLRFAAPRLPNTLLPPDSR